jgi:hypothetical protein
MFESHVDLSDITAADRDREQKVLSRCLAALAIYLQTGCTEKEAADAVWDGGDDNGVDAAYFDTGASRVLFVQAKWINRGAGEPEAKEIGVFVKGVRDAIEQDDTGFHPRLHARFADIALRLGTPGVRVHLVVICTGASELASHGVSVLDGFVGELNGDDPEPIASSEVIGLSEVYDGLASDPSQATLPIDATILEWSFVASPYPAYLESSTAYN